MSTSSTPHDSGYLDFNIYGYVPHLGAGIVFILAFSILTILHLALIAKSRLWWFSVLCVGGLSEIIGWAGRIWASKNYHSLNAFLIQQILLTLAPCFFSAACYGLLGMTIRFIGPQYSRLRPSWYLIIFCVCDLIAIVVQAVGGAMSAIALGNGESSTTGTNIMVSGIVIQLASMIVFCLFGLDFFYSWKQASDRLQPAGRINLLIAGLAWGTFWILVRCIYRVVELAQGWSGYLITHEPYFLCLDAIPMVFTCLGFLVAHPYYCFDGKHNSLNSNKGVERAGLSCSTPSEPFVKGSKEDREIC